MIRDTRDLHRRAAPERLRYFGKQESSTSIRSPFGQQPVTQAGTAATQQLQPLLQGLGIGTGAGAHRLQRQIASGRASGPLAQAIQGIQQFAPGVLPGAEQIGQMVSQQGQSAVQQLQQAIQGAQAQLPQWQQAAQQGLGAAQGALGGAENLYQQAAGQLPGLQQIAQQGTAGAQQDLARAQQLLSGGAAQGGAQQAVQLAQQYAQQAALPTGQQDLYRMAAQRVLQQMRPGEAARGLEAGGSGAQMEADTLRDLTYQFAQNRAQQQQQTVQGLNQAATGLGNIQTQAEQNLGAASTGVQQAAAGQAALGQSLIPYLNAIQSGVQGVGQATQTGANVAQAGVGLAGQGANAVNQLAQMLMQQYQIPMQQAGQLVNLLTAGVAPTTQMIDATKPIGVPSSKGSQIL
jgi:hypothetical protein